jgi:hypothetical protein
MAAQRFTATLEERDRGGGRWVLVPFDVREAFGEARPAVRGSVNGVPFRSRLAVYGGRTYLGLRRKIRDAAGIEAGDRVEVVLERDDAPREVELPEPLAAALAADAGARAAFERLSFTHRLEYARWIAEARREDTRARRVERAIAMLCQGISHP